VFTAFTKACEDYSLPRRAINQPSSPVEVVAKGPIVGAICDTDSLTREYHIHNCIKTVWHVTILPHPFACPCRKKRPKIFFCRGFHKQEPWPIVERMITRPSSVNSNVFQCGWKTLNLNPLLWLQASHPCVVILGASNTVRAFCIETVAKSPDCVVWATLLQQIKFLIIKPFPLGMRDM
jgi:hypothetical protein